MSVFLCDRFGVWVCYVLYFFLAVKPPVNLDCFVLLALTFVMLVTHLNIGIDACVTTAGAKVLRRVCLRTSMCRVCRLSRGSVRL